MAENKPEKLTELEELELFLKKRSAKRFLWIIIPAILIFILLLTVPIKRGRRQKELSGYDYVNSREVKVKVDIWQEWKLLGAENINGNITIIPKEITYNDKSSEAEPVPESQSLLFTGESAYNIFVENAKSNRDKSKKINRVEANLETEISENEGEPEVDARYAYMYSDPEMESLVLIGDAKNQEKDILVVASENGENLEEIFAYMEPRIRYYMENFDEFVSAYDVYE